MFKLNNWVSGAGVGGGGLTAAFLQNLLSIRSAPYNLRNSELKLD